MEKTGTVLQETAVQQKQNNLQRKILAWHHMQLIYMPFLQSIFQTEALSMSDLCTLLMLGAVSATLHEARRRYERSLNASMTFSSAVEELA